MWRGMRNQVSIKPIVYASTHRVKFSELDPYDRVSTGRYATYYVDHRMESLATTSDGT